MSFGFGVGDFLAIGQLSWKLYTQCFLIAKGAPQEFTLLTNELKSLHALMLLFAEEFKDENSPLLRSGDEQRKDMIGQMLENLKDTLSGLNNAFIKHRNLGGTDKRSSLKRGWDKFKWSLDARDVDALRAKITYHNGIMNLLLTCVGK
ncbi:hypothetical protein DFH27DRAFT_331619 [Peziza echinospora]|nr:hypothetical protein DFH27DRAFT_331619 [Peziza echinospora]